MKKKALAGAVWGEGNIFGGGSHTYIGSGTSSVIVSFHIVSGVLSSLSRACTQIISEKSSEETDK